MNDSGPGSRFGPYRLTRLLGSGGMGDVYEAEDTRKGRMVAVKLIAERFSGNPVLRSRMMREAETAGRLTEPHVVPIHDYGEIDGRLYLEMRLIDGTDLATALRQSGAMSPPRAVAIVSQIAAALDAAHSSGVTHRDVKPENVLLTDDDFAYLVDFGIARVATDPGLTQIGTAVGTCNYMAPERFGGAEVTYRSDIYSLSCVLAECLTGEPPYPGDSMERLIAAHLTEPAPRPSQLRPGRVPAAFDAVIAKGMAKNPQERYRSAGDLAIAAREALTPAEQNQAARILQRGSNAAPDSVAHTETASAPVYFGSTGAQAGPPASAPTDEHATRAQEISSAPASAWAAPSRIAPAERAPAGQQVLGVPHPGRRRRLLIGAAALVLVAAVGVVGYLVAKPGQHRSGGESVSAPGQTVLPFTEVNYRLSPGGVALDGNDGVYITSQGMYGRVLKLVPGSSDAEQLAFSDLYQPQGLAVDSGGAVYVSDFNNRVVKLAAGASDQTVLPFDGLNFPEGVAVDNAGNVYVADRGNNRVVKLAAETNTQTDLGFAGLNHPDGVAVDDAGNVYVTDTDNHRVLKLASGSSTQTVLPFAGLVLPWGVAVDSAGNVYVTDHSTSKVVKLPVGATTSTDLPFAGLNTPLAVAVDGAGNVYVADRGNDRVVKLATG